MGPSYAISCSSLKCLPEIFLKNVAGVNDLKDALQRFGGLEQRELLTGIAQVSSDATVLKDGV